MIELKGHPNAKYIELGCGDRRHPAVQVAVDVRFIEGHTDFVVNFEDPTWPIGSDEFDAAYSAYVLEHISWRNTLAFLKECFRIIKPGGKLVLVTPDTEAQMRHLLKTSDWDDGGSMLFGDLNYQENSHKAFINPAKLTQLLNQAGFESVLITPYGEKQTDMVTQAMKPAAPVPQGVAPKVLPNVLGEPVQPVNAIPEIPKEPLPPASVIFDRRYWDGGNEWGGFTSGYSDFPCHQVTAEHVLARKPSSVIELGPARGYILKRLEDAGINCYGMETSKHCSLTRVSTAVYLEDFTEHWHAAAFDLCFSIAVLDHVPEQQLPMLIEQMKRYTNRGLHGINFGPQGNDRTRQTCKPQKWWQELFQKYAPNWPVEIVDKDTLENGNLSPSYLAGDGKLKVQFGSHTSMLYQGWLNTDDKDLSQFANQMHFRFKQLDVREGLPFDTESVHAIFHCHMLEHVTYKEGLAFLKECRRVLRPDGAMRIIVPDAEELSIRYHNHISEITGTHSDFGSRSLSEFDELSSTCAAAKTSAQKLYELLHAHHHSMYDYETLAAMLEEAGLQPYQTWFRHRALVDGVGVAIQKQIIAETLDILPDISLFVEAYVPIV